MALAISSLAQIKNTTNKGTKYPGDDAFKPICSTIFHSTSDNSKSHNRYITTHVLISIIS